MARNTSTTAAPAAPARIEPEEQRAAGPTPTPTEESTQKQEEQKQEEQKQEEQKQEEQKQEEQKQEEQKQEEQKQEEQKQEEQPDQGAAHDADAQKIAHAVGGYYARALKDVDGQERGMMRGIMAALLERPAETPKEGARPAPILVALTGSTEKVNNAGAGLLRQARALAGKGATRADVAAWVAVIVASAIHEANAIRQDADLDARSVTIKKAIKAAQIKD